MFHAIPVSLKQPMTSCASAKLDGHKGMSDGTASPELLEVRLAAHVPQPWLWARLPGSHAVCPPVCRVKLFLGNRSVWHRVKWIIWAEASRGQRLTSAGENGKTSRPSAWVKEIITLPQNTAEEVNVFRCCYGSLMYCPAINRPCCQMSYSKIFSVPQKPRVSK